MRLLAFLIALLPFASFAQEKPRRTCRVLVLGESGSVPSPLHLSDGTSTREIELPRMNLSKFYEMPAGALTLKLLKSPPAEGQPAPAGSPAVTVAENVSSFYLVLSADPANKVVPVRMQVIDSSQANFKKGQMLWYNLTALDIGGQVGKQQVAVKARSKAITDPPAAAREDYNINLNYRKAETGKVYPIFETKWLFDPDARTVVFVVNQPDSTLPRVLAFKDIPDTPDPAARNP